MTLYEVEPVDIHERSLNPCTRSRRAHDYRYSVATAMALSIALKLKVHLGSLLRYVCPKRYWSLSTIIPLSAECRFCRVS